MIPIWPKVSLKTIYKGFYDGPHATPAESNEGAIFLGIKNVTESGRLDLSEIRYIAEADLGKWTKRVIPQKDDIVFSYEATLHRYARIPEGFRGCLGRRMALIRVNPEIANVDFVFCYFLGPLWRCEVEKNILSGATVDRIPLTNVPDFKIYLPPIQIQQKIADILSAYDDLIENNLKRIKLLEEMAQITYEEWFVRLKFPGHETTPVDSATGLPVGWVIKKLGEILTLNYGKALTAEDRSNGPIPVYGSAGIVGFHNASIVKGPGVIVGRKGNVGSIFWSDDDFYPIDTVFFVSSKLPLLYVNFLLSHIEFVNNDAAVPGLNRNAAYLIKCRIPPLSLIEQFSGFATPLFKTINNLKKQNQLLKEARDILLPRLMTGMIDVEQLVLPESLGELSSNLTQESQAA